MNRCDGHREKGYKEYVVQMVADFKKAYGGYVTAFGYLTSNEELQYMEVWPICNFEGECGKQISEKMLREILKTDANLKELEKELANLKIILLPLPDVIMAPKISSKGPETRDLKSRFLEEIKMSRSEEEAKELDLLNLKSTTDNLTNCVVNGQDDFTVMCHCGFDFSVIGMFKNYGKDFKGLCNNQLQINPHLDYANGKTGECGKILFKDAIKSEGERREDIACLWRLYIHLSKWCCIACREKPRRYVKYCANTWIHINESGGKEVMVCNKCDGELHLDNCPVCGAALVPLK